MSSPSRGEPYGDPFADRPRQTHFQEPPAGTYDSAVNSPFESTTNLPREFGGAGYGDEDYAEKLPLTGGESYGASGYYPPGSVTSVSMTRGSAHLIPTAQLIPLHTETRMHAQPQLCHNPSMGSKPHGGVVRPLNAA